MDTPSPHMEQFDAVFVPRDHVEALLINHQFKSLRVQGKLAAVALKEAVDHVDAELADPESQLRKDNPELAVINADKFGYETAKKAMRWWNYRAAYLEDLKPVYNDLDMYSQGNPWATGLETHYDSYRQKLDELQEYQAAFGERIISGESVEVALAAALEAERLCRRINGEIMLNPIQVEQDFTFEILANVLDADLESPTTRHNDDSSVNLHVWDDLTPEMMFVSRYKTKDATTYKVKRSLPGMEDAPESSLVSVTYNCIDTAEGVKFVGGDSPFGPPAFDTLAAVELIYRLKGNDDTLKVRRDPARFKQS